MYRVADAALSEICGFPQPPETTDREQKLFTIQRHIPSPYAGGGVDHDTSKGTPFRSANSCLGSRRTLYGGANALKLDGYCKCHALSRATPSNIRPPRHTHHFCYCVMSLLLRSENAAIRYVGRLVQGVGRSSEVDANDIAAGHKISAAKREVPTW